MPDEPSIEPDPSPERDAEDAGTTPRWVKVFGAVLAVVVALVIVIAVVGGSGHGPGQHFGAASHG